MAARNSTFDSKLRERAAAGKDVKKMIEKRIPMWLAAVEVVGHLVQRWLATQVSAGLVKIRSEPKQIVEELTGPYSTKRWIVSIGKDRVFIEPIGTFVIGAFGRIDLVGPADKIVLVRTEDSAKPAAWEIVDPADPKRLTPFNQSTFQTALLAVLGEP
jgi:hypothetical protein